MELEKLESKQEIEVKKPLTRKQALKRIYKLDEEMTKTRTYNPDILNWHDRNGDDEERSLKGSWTLDASLPHFPLLPMMRMTKSNLATRKKVSRYSWLIGTAMTGTAISLFGMSALYFIPFAIGAFVSGFSTTRFYKGTKDNKLRWLLSSIFLGKKSRKAILGYREELEKFNSLREPFELLVELVRKEIEADNLLEIVNKKPDKNGYYIIMLDNGLLTKVTKEKYQKMFNISQKEIDVKEKREILNGLLEKKIEEFKTREITS